MSDMQSFEDRFARRLRAYAAAEAPPASSAAVARAVAAGVAARRGGYWALRRPRRLAEWRRVEQEAPIVRPAPRGLPRPRLTVLGQFAVVGAVAVLVVVGLAVWVSDANRAIPPGQTPETTTTPRVNSTLPSSAAWRSAVRQEPGGSPTGPRDPGPDAVGDSGDPDAPFVDIVSVESSGEVRLTNEFRVAGAPPPSALEGRRIAYGVVIDRDLDGTPDLQAGVESDGNVRQVWMTDLETGDTALCQCVFAQLVGDDLNVEMWHPDERDDGVTGGFAFRRAPRGLPMNYYVWASIVERGAAIATDYAPDNGWLEIAPDVAAQGRANPHRPGPLRPEPVGGGPVVGQGSSADPAGDAGAPPADLVDIVRVGSEQGCWLTLTTEACVFFEIAARLPPRLPEPSERWLGYGLVVDTDGDGAGDWRYGMDNAGNGAIQMWRTNLASGLTEAAPVGVLEDPGLMDVVLPPQVGSDVAAGHVFVARDDAEGFRFYVWASTVSNGTGAVDYAPDTGWLELSAAPGSTR